ncbi:DUF2939 domain-containing protein [Sphingomonas sp.]|uniref:DUF2939 domain-containing protein n=1 Tax=Sphingomonas sp. TaxID=28214 RepID=UPI0025F917F1|nr:DUF2939 domain-containing protein [Sphingomonas sp.]
MIAALLLVAAVAGAGWYFGSPWWTLWQMKTAAEASDVKALSAYVDYPALRHDLRHQYAIRLRGSTPASAVGRIVRGALARGAVEVFARPEGVRLMFVSSPVTSAIGLKGPAIQADRMRMRYEGPNQFRLVDPAPGGAALTFRRYGLGWKLSGLTLPGHISSDAPDIAPSSGSP